MKKKNENYIVNVIDGLINEDKFIDAEIQKLQREKDLKVDSINKEYENEIDKLLRRSDFIKMQMTQIREYAKKNLN